jgi:hypothetical protein
MRKRAGAQLDRNRLRTTDGFGMQRRHALSHRVVVRALAVSATALFAHTSVASPPEVRVRGTATIQTTAFTTAESTRVRGTVRDDAGYPLANARVGVRLLDANSRLPLPLPPSDACTPSRRQDRVESAQGSQIIVQADGEGRFCLHLGSAPERAVASLSLHDATDLYTSSPVEVTLEPQRRNLKLEFAPHPQVLLLDRGPFEIGVHSEIDPAFPVNAPHEPLTLELWLEAPGEPERLLDRTLIRPGERAAFGFEAREVGRPGPAEVRARFAGSHLLKPCELGAAVVRAAGVRLSLDEPLAPVAAGSAAELGFSVTSIAGPVADGMVEVRGSRLLGAAAVRDGRAVVPITASPSSDGGLAVVARYAPTAPWWHPSEELRFHVPIAPPSRWPRLLWVIGLAVAVGLLVTAWRRPRHRRRTKAASPQPTLAGRAHLSLIGSAERGTGWSGCVLDAHDGQGIGGASLTLHIPSFAAAPPSVTAMTNADGSFRLPTTPSARIEGAELEVCAPFHASFRTGAPPEGELLVQLVSRRRALVARLVSWAIRRGRPWLRMPEPTPGRVAEVARDRREPKVAAWAEAVERAAYGPDALGAESEQKIREDEPPR